MLPFVIPLFGSGSGSAWDPARKAANITLSNNNQTASGTSGGGSAYGTRGWSTGKRYFEVLVGAVSGNVFIGLGNASATTAEQLGATANSGGIYYADGTNNLANALTNGTSYTTGAVMSVAVDLDAHTVTFRENNVIGGTSNTLPAGTWYPAITLGDSTVTLRTLDFTYAPPSGFLPWS
jgi:hypothetical protein